MELLGAFALAATRLSYRRDSVHGLLQDLGVVNVGRRVDHTERDAFSVDHTMALRALFALVRRIRSCLLAPPGAGTLDESKDALSQLIWSASPKRSRSLRCNRSHTPASCHSFRRRQQVMPEPQPISWGSISQGMPLFKTNRMPVRAAGRLCVACRR